MNGVSGKKKNFRSAPLDAVEEGENSSAYSELAEINEDLAEEINGNTTRDLGIGGKLTSYERKL